MHKFGTLLGAAMVWVDQNLFAGRLPFTLHDSKPDYACLEEASTAKVINYPKPDNQITFDRLSSVFMSNTNHEEDQPCHLNAEGQFDSDPRKPAEIRRARSTLLPGRVVRDCRGGARPSLPDQCTELRALQNL